MKLTHLDGAGDDPAPQAPLDGPPGVTRPPARAVLEHLGRRGRRDDGAGAVGLLSQGLHGLLRSRASIRELYLIDMIMSRVLNKSREPP